MEHFDTLIKLLSDPVSLSENQSAVAACQQLNQVMSVCLHSLIPTYLEERWLQRFAHVDRIIKTEFLDIFLSMQF